MGRIMAVDYVQKRPALAVTAMLKMIANRLTVVSSREATGYIARYVSQEPVDLIVVGYPKQMNNEPSENMKRVEAFVAQLTKTLPSIPVEYYDERFTSIMAQRALIDGGLKKKKRQDKGLVDEISAVLILQGFLERLRNKR